MKSSRIWFGEQYGQTMNRDVSTIPTIARSGVNGTPPPKRRQEDEKGQKFFIVGKTVVGGKEVVG